MQSSSPLNSPNNSNMQQQQQIHCSRNGNNTIDDEEEYRFCKNDSQQQHNGDNGGSGGICATINGSGDARVKIDSKFDCDVVRLIGQHLRSLGLHRTVEQLFQESGCRLDHPTAAKFQQHIMNGDWHRAETDLTELKSLIANPAHILDMKFFIREQKYLELLDEGKVIEALNCLRNEITPLNHKHSRLYKLSSLIMCTPGDELRRVANWEGFGQASRIKLMERLQTHFPPSVMLPPRRLLSLLNQAQELQIERCPYHNGVTEKNFNNISLLGDHLCNKEQFPCETVQIITDHLDEVNYVKFSNDGTRLATASKDEFVIIWDIDPETLRLTSKFTFDHTSSSTSSKGAYYFSWSPDDSHLLVCGTDDCSDVWIWNTQNGTLRTKFSNNNEESLTAVSWSSDGKRFVTGGIRGQFYLCDIDGEVLQSYEGVRINCLYYKSDGMVLASDSHYRIRGHFFEEQSEQINYIQEDHSILSFTVDDDVSRCLLNVAGQGVHLWDLNDKILLRKYQGLTQGHFTIHSCFGGKNQVFIASGSEDSCVYIWHVKNEKPIAILRGHEKTVNAVAWNPKYPEMLASCSDDATVRIWGPARRLRNSNSSKSEYNFSSISNSPFCTNSHSPSSSKIPSASSSSSTIASSGAPSEANSPNASSTVIA